MMLQVFLTFPSHARYVLGLCSRLLHCAADCFSGWYNYSDEAPLLISGRYLVELLLSCEQELCKPWLCSMPSSTNTPAKHFMPVITAFIWQALGIAKYLHLQAIPQETLALLVQLGAQQPLCWSINYERCLL